MNNIEEQIKENEPLVRFLIKKYFPTFVNDEDVFQCGLIGLWKALETYNPAYGSTFSSYASKYIINSISNYWHSSNEKENKKELVPYDELYQEPLKNIIFTENDAINKAIIKDALSVLNERQKTIILLRANNYTLKEIGAMYNCSKQAVDIGIRRSINKMKKYVFGEIENV